MHRKSHPARVHIRSPRQRTSLHEMCRSLSSFWRIPLPPCHSTCSDGFCRSPWRPIQDVTWWWWCSWCGCFSEPWTLPTRPCACTEEDSRLRADDVGGSGPVCSGAAGGGVYVAACSSECALLLVAGAGLRTATGPVLPYPWDAMAYGSPHTVQRRNSRALAVVGFTNTESIRRWHC